MESFTLGYTFGIRLTWDLVLIAKGGVAVVGYILDRNTLEVGEQNEGTN